MGRRRSGAIPSTPTAAVRRRRRASIARVPAVARASLIVARRIWRPSQRDCCCCRPQSGRWHATLPARTASWLATAGGEAGRAQRLRSDLVSTADPRDELKALDATLSSIEQVLDVPALRRQVTELEAQAAAPDLWNDPEEAQRITSKLSHAQGDVRRVEGLQVAPRRRVGACSTSPNPRKTRACMPRRWPRSSR